MIHFIGTQFPPTFLWARYEISVIDSVKKQINIKFADQKNLLINLTWFGPQFNNGEYSKYLELIGQKFYNLFLLSTVDPAMITPEQINSIATSLGNPTVYKIGNFDTEYHFNFFAPILKKHFQIYTNDELKLVDPEHIFIMT